MHDEWQLNYYYHFTAIMHDNLRKLAPPLQTRRILQEQSFTAHMPLLH